jgi:hypothetical protein
MCDTGPSLFQTSASLPVCQTPPFQVEAAHAALSAAYPSEQRVLGGADGDVQQLFDFSRRLDPLMPFDAKHAAQHASLVGEWLLTQQMC